MKRFLLSFVAVVGLLATSCVQDATSDMELNKQGVVTFAVDAQHTSRAYGVAAEATDLYYAVYQNGTLLNEISVLPGEEPVELINGATNVSLSLATGLEYEFIFWAASEDAISDGLYTLDFANKTMTLNPNALVASDESLDAFYTYAKFTVEGTATHPMTLKRPFAQINVATGDTEKATNAGLTVDHTWFEVSGAFDTLNLESGIASGAATLNYTAAAKTGEKITANSKEYDLLGVIYVLANATESPLNNVKFSYNRNAGEAAVKSIEVPSAPIKRNARTNLVGNILTSNNGFDVDIDDEFENIITPESNKGYAINDEGGYIVLTSEGFLNAINDATDNANIALATDVDLTGVDYTPRTFKSLVFNGNYHTISGVKVEGQSQAALFGKTWKFDIQNVTLANSTFVANNVDGEDAAAGFIGFLQTYSAGSKLVNCHVENSTFGVAKYVGGLVAYKDGTYPIALENCSVKNSTLISKYSEDGGANYKGHCGGLVGYFCGEATSTIVNCVVENNTFDVLGPRCGLFIGSAQNNYAVSGSVKGNTDLAQLCGVVNKITDWSNVEYQVSNAAELKAGIDANFKTIYIKGQIDLTEEILALYNGTIIGADDTACLNTRTFVVKAADEAFHLSDKTINFKNITIKVPAEDGDFLKTGFVAAGTMNFENCVFEGQVTLNGSATWTFDDCEFGGADSGAYASFVYGATKATFNDCSFSGVDRAAKIYGTGDVLNVEYNNCTFTSTTSNKYAVNIDASYAATNVALNGCSQTGMPGLFAVTGTKAIVTVNGAEYVGNGLYKSGSKYSVENAEGLALLNSKMCDKTAGRAIVVELLSDIDFTGKTWTPVDSHVDLGFIITEFNGNGHTISNLTINGQAMFTRFSNTHDVVVKDVTFDNATVNSTSINTAIIVGHTYDNLLLENVDVKNSTIVGGYKVAALVGTVYNESASTITATLKGCDVENTTVKALTYDFTTAGFVAFVYSDNNDRIAFENCSINGLKLYAPNVYNYHAAVYTESLNDDIVLHNEAEGVTVTNVTFENI